MTAHDARFTPRPGHIALVGAGPGTADLLTLRAVDRLRQADVIFHDRLVTPEVLALAVTRSVRVFVGKEVGAHAWPQARIDADRAAGIDIEIVPGITAASAGAASLCRPLTERGQTERLVIVTATCRPGDPSAHPEAGPCRSGL